MKTSHLGFASLLLLLAVAGIGGYALFDLGDRLAAIERLLERGEASVHSPPKETVQRSPDALQEKVDRLARELSRLRLRRDTTDRDPTGGSSVGELQKQMQALTLQVASVRQKVDSIQGEVRGLADIARLAPGDLPPSRQTVSDMLVDKEGARERAKAARQEKWYGLSTRHDGEIRDDRWASDTEGALHDALTSDTILADHALLTRLDCRTSLCLVSWQFTENLSSEEYFELENEMAAALGRAGLSQGVLAGSAVEGGIAEGYFFRQLPEEDLPKGQK